MMPKRDPPLKHLYVMAGPLLCHEPKIDSPRIVLLM